jgi:hypothetical protein
MDSERGVDVGGLQSDLDATRAAISGTAHQLRERMTTTMDWHTYIERYPGSILASAAFVGFVLGRQVAARLGLVRGSAAQWSAPQVSRGTVIPTREPLTSDGGFGPARASWERLGRRIEGLVNLSIDEVADATERVLVPVLVSSVQALLEGHTRREGPRVTSTFAPTGEGRRS